MSNLRVNVFGLVWFFPSPSFRTKSLTPLGGGRLPGLPTEAKSKGLRLLRQGREVNQSGPTLEL